MAEKLARPVLNERADFRIYYALINPQKSLVTDIGQNTQLQLVLFTL